MSSFTPTYIPTFLIELNKPHGQSSDLSEGNGVPRQIFLYFPKVEPILVYFIFINNFLCFKRIMSTFCNIFQNVDEKITITIKIPKTY